jgi:hypothetical protein
MNKSADFGYIVKYIPELEPLKARENAMAIYGWLNEAPTEALGHDFMYGCFNFQRWLFSRREGILNCEG